MIWLLYVAVTIFVGTVSADKLHIQLLPILSNNTFEPTKIVYESQWPMIFEVTVQRNTTNAICQGVEGVEFGIISVYGENNGINIIPTWNSTTKYSIDFYFLHGDENVDMITFEDLDFATGAYQKIIYKVIIDSKTITVVSKNDLSKTKYQPMNPTYLPDFIDNKYLSLSFFQPLQIEAPNTVANKCNLFLDYNGKYVWQSGPPLTSA